MSVFVRMSNGFRIKYRLFTHKHKSNVVTGYMEIIVTRIIGIVPRRNPKIYTTLSDFAIDEFTVYVLCLFPDVKSICLVVYSAITVVKQMMSSM